MSEQELPAPLAATIGGNPIGQDTRSERILGRPRVSVVSSSIPGNLNFRVSLYLRLVNFKYVEGCLLGVLLREALPFPLSLFRLSDSLVSDRRPP